uniref:Uncharacterized protein n=1 Tax=Rhizophora mucronata TaxID=61149 RepID=A0A2P2Q4A7_RHIMU
MSLIRMVSTFIHSPFYYLLKPFG